MLSNKRSFFASGGGLVDLHSSIRLDEILDFNKDTLLNSIKRIKKHIQKRQQKIPHLIERAISKQLDFFAQERFKTKENTTEFPLSKRVQLFSYFVREKPCKEVISLYKQLDLAARIWNSNFQNYDRKPLVRFKRFFKNAIKQYGPVWDIANGLAYASLFKGI